MKAVSQFTISEINDGAQGAQGVSVTSEQKQYRLSNSSTELTGSGEGYTWSTTMPQVSANTYLWIRTATNLSDNSTIYSNATCDVTISGVVSTVDSVQQSITNKVWSSDISSSIDAYDTNNGTETSIRDRVSQTETDISGITSRVSDVEATTTSLGTRMTTAESSITQNANNISSKVSKDSIISEINQSAESVTIQASKVDLIGNVTFSMLDTAAQNRITTVENNSSTALNGLKVYTGTCSTATGTTAKVVTCSDTDFELTNGVTITVTFSTASIANAPTLNVNSKGAKAIYFDNAVVSTDNKFRWKAGSVITFQYNGTYWVVQNYSNAEYFSSSTAAATAAKAATATGTFVLCRGTTVNVNFTTASTTDALTLNIGETGNFAIRYKGANTSSSNKYTWDAGTTLAFTYDGALWYLNDGGSLAAKEIASSAESIANTANTNATHAKDIIDNWATDATSTTTTIKGGLIQTHTILSDALSTDAIMSSNYVGPEVTVSSGAFVTYEDGVGEMPVKSCVLDIEPVQSGTGDPSPDNVRPISGWTEATATRTGKNLVENTGGSKTISGVTFTMNDDGTVTANGTATAQIQYFVFGTTVSSSADKKFAKDVIISTGQIGSATTYRGVVWTTNSAGEERNYFIDGVDKTVPANSTIKGFAIRIMNGITVNNVVFKPMIRLATETDGTYEPYSGNTYTITFPSEAGTVYGGTLDVTTGKLTVDRGIYKVATAGSYDSSGKAINFGTISDVVSSDNIDVTKYKCVALSAVTNIGAVRNDANDNVFTVFTGTIWAKSSAWSSVSDAQTFINNNDVNITYPLATPITYQLTPTEIQSIQGYNIMYADVGDMTVGFQNAYGDDVYSQNGTYLDLYSGSLTTPHFVVDNVTGNAYFKGEIVSDSGTIGGWVIGQNELYSVYDDGMFTNYKVFLKNYEGAGSDWDTTKVIGINSGVSYPFYVTGAGKLYAQNAEINGIINSISGSIGGWEISEKELSSSVEIDDVEYSLFMRKFDDGTIIVTMNGGTSINVNYTGDGVFELTPQTNGSGTITFSYNLSDYPTKKFHVWSSYHDDRNLQVLPTLQNNGVYGSVVSDSVVVDQITGEQTIDISSFDFTSGTLYVSLSFTNMNTSDGTYTLKFEISDYDDIQYKIVSVETINEDALDVGVIGISRKENSVKTYPFYVNRRGEIYAERAFLNGGEIAGFTIVKNDTAGMGQTTANGGHVYPTGLYVHTSATEDGVAYEYETGIRGDAEDATNAAFYVRRIASGGQWTQNLDDLVFYVRNNGYFYAKNAKIDGEIKASQFTARYNNSSSSPLVELTGSNLTVSNSSYSTWIAPQFITMNNLSSGSGSVYSRKIQMSANLGYESYNGYAYSSMYANSVDVAYESTPDDDPYTVRHGRFTASSAGNIGIWDVENQNWIIQSTSSYNVNIPHPLTTNSIQVGSTSGTNIKINTGYIDVINTTSDRTCRLVSADSGNIGIYEPTASSYLIYSDTSSQVHVPHMFYCYGKIDETQRCPVGSSNVAKQGMSWMGGTAASTLSIHGQWNSSTPSTKTIAVSSSDIRLKKDIVDSQVDALEVINRVKLREFTWKEDGVRQKIGVVVDELEELDPLLSVGGGEDENGEPIYKSVNNLLMISYLTKAVQQLSAQVDSLQNEIKELKGDK